MSRLENELDTSVLIESQLVGALLVGRTGEGAWSLDGEDFHSVAHREVYLAMRGLWRAGEPHCDPVCLAAKLDGRLKAVGGLPGIVAMVGVQSWAGSTSDLDKWVEILKQRSATRRLRDQILVAVESSSDESELLTSVYSALGSFDTGKREQAVGVGEGVATAIEDIRQTMASPPPPGWVSRDAIATGYPDLDALGGLLVGAVTIIAGRPSHGKSSLARGIASNVARNGLGVHTFSLEDPRGPFFRRQLSDMSGVDLGHLMSGRNLDAFDLGKLMTAHDRLKEMPWRVDDSAGLTAGDIAARVVREKHRITTRLVVVDYIQLLGGAGDGGESGRRSDLERAAESLVTLARREGVALVLLSQLSRACENREDKRPLLNDLRETGVLEQVASSAWFVYLPSRYARNDDERKRLENEAYVLVRKNKNGAVGEVRMHWSPKVASYRHYEGGF